MSGPQLAASAETAPVLGEQELVDRFLHEPCEESYCELFRVLAPRVLCYFRTRGCGPELAEDLLQEVMLTVYRRTRMLRRADLFRPWLYKIARNVLLQHLRRLRREVVTVGLEAAAHEPANPETDPLAGSRFLEWMAALAPDEREIMTLRYVDGLAYHEIADVMGLPAGTVQWKVFNAKRKLARRFRNGQG